MTPVELKEILDTVRNQEDLRPEVDEEGHVLKTFCNIALDRILLQCKIPRLINPLSGVAHMANDMIDAMRNSPSLWMGVNGDVACARASHGLLVVACERGEVHGHVAPVYPVKMEWSGSWGKNVPVLSNVGKRNEVLKASQCFRKEPLYFAAKGETK